MPPELIDIDGPRGIEADRAGPSEIVQGRGTDRLRTNIDDVSFVDDGVTAPIRRRDAEERRSSAFVREKANPGIRFGPQRVKLRGCGDGSPGTVRTPRIAVVPETGWRYRA